MAIPLERYLAIDCEMVGCRKGQALARVALVDHSGTVVYHSYVFVHPLNVTDYRTDTSGIAPDDLTGAPTFETVRTELLTHIRGKILVGHALFNDLAAIKYKQIYEDHRDTALYMPLRQRGGVVRDGEYPALRTLAGVVLGKEIQVGGHSPIEDAQATMAIFMSVREEYEAALQNGDMNSVLSGLPESLAKWYR